MGHDKIDKHIKQKLEQRTIQPSSEAWGELANMLDEEKEQSNKKGFYFYTVAASIVLFLGFFFASQFGDDQIIVNDDTVVTIDENDIKPKGNNVTVPPLEGYSNNEVVKEEQKDEKVNVVASNPVNYAYAQSFNKEEENRQEKEISAIKEKVNQYLAQLEKNKQEKLDQEKSAYDIDAEINALLAEASSNLPDKTVKNDIPIIQLDKETDMLLADAFQELNFNPEEDTVNETLKNKLFKQLEKGYFKSKMLLAERSQLVHP